MAREDIEKEVFIKFANICPYQIDINSIQKNDPPKPDISCKLLNGDRLDFELTECIHRNVSQPIHDQLDLRKLLYTELEKLPEQKKEEIKEKYKHSSITVDFCKEAKKHKKQQAVPMIFDFLIRIQNSNEDIREYNFENEEFKDIVDIVNTIRIKNKLNFERPYFIIPASAWYKDPIIDCIENKFRKTYVSESPVELLVFYGLQPSHLIDDKENIDDIAVFIQEHIISSIFRRVWIYLCNEDKIVYNYPSLKKH